MPPTTSDPSTCARCGSERDGHSYLVLYGDWVPDRDAFARAPEQRPLCRRCWSDYYQSVPGAYYELTDRADTQRVWDMLAASDGRLVADCYALFVGARPFVRVVDDEVRAVKPTLRPDPDAADDAYTTTTERLDIDRDRFFEVLDAERTSRPKPAVVILRPVEDTPFGDVRERGDDSRQLTEFGAMMHGADTDTTTTDHDT